MRALAGLKVLIVEDEGGIAFLLEDMLSELGCEVAASAARLDEACRLARTGNFDIAVLDVNLNGHLVFPAAEILRERGIPFLFSTGYGAKGIPVAYGGVPVMVKPFAIEDLQRQLVAALLGSDFNGEMA